jgi:hypothetical protein
MGDIDIAGLFDSLRPFLNLYIGSQEAQRIHMYGVISQIKMIGEQTYTDGDKGDLKASSTDPKRYKRGTFVTSARSGHPRKEGHHSCAANAKLQTFINTLWLT